MPSKSKSRSRSKTKKKTYGVTALKKQFATARKKYRHYMSKYTKAIRAIKKAKTKKALSVARKSARSNRSKALKAFKRQHVIYNKIIRKVKASGGSASYKKYSGSKTASYLRKKNALLSPENQTRLNV